MVFVSFIDGARASRLQEVNVTVFDPQTCSSFYGGKMYEFMICAGAAAGGMDACQVNICKLGILDFFGLDVFTWSQLVHLFSNKKKILGKYVYK